MSALGLRSPRSIWLRYGLETPACCASWRMEILACSRCSRMYWPIEFTLTMPSLWHGVLAIANGQLADPKPRNARACAGLIGGGGASLARSAARSTSSALRATARPRAYVNVSSMPTRRCPPAPSAPNITGSVVRPIPVADQVAPAGRAATAAVSVATSPGIPPGTPITRSQWTWPPAGAPNSPSSRCSVATCPRSNSSNSGTTWRSWVSWYRSLMNGQGLWNTSSPKLTVPQVSEQASGAASRTASRAAKPSVTAPPVESWTIRSVPARSAATVSARRAGSSVGRASSSLMCTWMTAAPAASHSLAVSTSSFSVTGSAGTADLPASAPVGATVIRVLLAAMAARLPLGRLARGEGQVGAGEGERLGQVRLPVLLGRRAVGLDLGHHHALVPGRGQQAEQFGARLPAAARHQMLVGDRPAGRARAVGQVDVRQPTGHDQLARHGQGVGPGGGGVRQVQRDVRDVQGGRIPVGGVRDDLVVAGPERVHVLHREQHFGPPGQVGQALLEAPGVLPLPAERRVDDDDPGSHALGEIDGAAQLLPRVAAPHRLGEQQARRVHGQDGELVVVPQAAQHGRVLAHRVVVDHHLDPVVPEAGGGLEGVRRALGVDGRRGQGDRRTRCRAVHCWPPSVGLLPAY